MTAARRLRRRSRLRGRLRREAHGGGRDGQNANFAACSANIADIAHRRRAIISRPGRVRAGLVTTRTCARFDPGSSSTTDRRTCAPLLFPQRRQRGERRDALAPRLVGAAQRELRGLTLGIARDEIARPRERCRGVSLRLEDVDQKHRRQIANGRRRVLLAEYRFELGARLLHQAALLQHAAQAHPRLDQRRIELQRLAEMLLGALQPHLLRVLTPWPGGHQRRRRSRHADHRAAALILLVRPERERHVAIVWIFAADALEVLHQPIVCSDRPAAPTTRRDRCPGGNGRAPRCRSGRIFVTCEKRGWSTS